MLVSNYGKVLRTGERATIDLLNEKKLFIKKAMDPQELSSLNA